ncbi:TonB-linked SusC/RagA family outer membrane protein [Sphingobacterium allocomposti]|uniref:TonB-linked SusC/RagA family outer membrane protein n=1 Tax=Sphingobacterium allocomposti TaxID=415956 RepID=A0A5S5DKM2_9SPHI|nr:TonB-dependent receptor [Sphingobacterium composti Yoo et al. 2007 non Ten et al. 2007]TYP95908.1 TonB-linked SusC/RagA family outer membrane protein [Sphingobacterium composti Yoo et al. 2007 non Ten et al. 2007]
MWNSNKFKKKGSRVWIVPLVLLATSYGNAYAHGNLFPEERGSSYGAQVQQTVTGTVKDAGTGEPIIGATVAVKGTTVATQTDENGAFSIEATAGQVLTANFLGYKTAEVTVGTGPVNFSLEGDESSLEEVVVVGYGTMRKSDVTGSISMVKGEDMVKAQNFSPLDNLRGKAAGVNIFSNSSQPGAYANRVVIRGMATINSSSNPLYVVDGVVMEDFHLLNPNDIDRIEVLKDASSAAIYGARGANGVILVTTKRGSKDGRKTVSYQGSVSSSSPQRYMEVLNAQEWVDAFMKGLENENKWHDDFLANRNENWTPWSLNKSDWFNDPNYFDANGNPLYDTDWQREATRTALSHNHQLNIQQGDESSSMGAFLNYTDQQGIVNNTDNRRINGKLAYDSKPKEWLSTSINLTANHTWGRFTPEDGGGQDARRTMIEMLPWYPVYQPDGRYTSSASSSVSEVLGFEGMSNPVAILDLQKRMRYNTQIFGNAALTFHLADGLDLKTQFGIDSHKKAYKGYSSITLNNLSMPNGWADIQNSDILYWQEETYLTYNKQFDKHRINAMAGLSWQERTFDYSRARTEGFTSDFFEWYNLGAGSIPSTPESSWNRWAMNSYFLRAAYSYNDRYSATVTGRYDGSSKFGANNKYAFFPSLGLAWNVSNEDFLAGNTLISNLKLHTSYGLTGNSEINPYQALANVTSGTILMGGSRSPYSYVSSIANPDLRWEKTGTYDVGVELGLFQNRLNFDVSYYNRKTTDLLLEAPLPNSSGFSWVMRNIGSVRNQGVDIMVTATPVQRDEFTWNTTLNMNYNKNEVLQLGANNEDIPQLSWVGGPNAIIRVGENLNSFYGYRRYGVYTVEDYENGDIAKEQIGRPKRSSTQEILGKGAPDWTGSFINNFSYRRFDLMVDLQFVYGVETMQQFYHSTYDRFGITNGLKEILYGAYDGTNPNTMQQAVVLTNSGHRGQDTNVDSSWVVDGSYLRFNVVQLGYTFEPGLAKKMGFSSLRVYGSANNPWLITSKDFKGYDPESTSQGDSNKFGQNITFFSYPRAKTFTFGVNLTL